MYGSNNLTPTIDLFLKIQYIPNLHVNKYSISLHHEIQK